MKDSDGNINSDVEYSRGVYLELIEQGRESIQNMSDLAQAIEHPRAFEVLAGMIKQTADITDKLMDLHKKNKEIRKLPGLEKGQPESDPRLAGPTNILTITSTDLQRMLRDEDDDVIEGRVDSG
jgi:hypothetical protein